MVSGFSFALTSAWASRIYHRCTHQHPFGHGMSTSSRVMRLSTRSPNDVPSDISPIISLFFALPFGVYLTQIPSTSPTSVRHIIRLPYCPLRSVPGLGKTCCLPRKRHRWRLTRSLHHFTDQNAFHLSSTFIPTLRTDLPSDGDPTFRLSPSSSYPYRLRRRTNASLDTPTRSLATRLDRTGGFSSSSISISSRK